MRMTLVKKVAREVLFQAQEYHKVDEQLMLAKGLTTTEFQRSFLSQIQNGTVFTFNPKFQYPFLLKEIGDGTPYGFDLPLMVKASDSRMGFPEEALVSLWELQKHIEQRIKRTPGMKTICRIKGLDPEPPATVLPCDYAVDCLYALWQTLTSATVLQL